MPGQVRLSDRTVGAGSHGLTDCPHRIRGVFVIGSNDTLTNSRPSIRMFDKTHHNCPHCKIGMAIRGSNDVLINSLPAHRLGDGVTEFCGRGRTVGASSDVIVN